MCDYLSVTERYNCLLENEINERKCKHINIEDLQEYNISDKSKKIGYYKFKNEIRWFDGKKLYCKHKKNKNYCYFCKYGDDNILENRSKRWPDKHWESLKSKKIYAGQLSKILGFKSYEDWYNITKKDFEENRGAGLLTKEYFDKGKSIKDFVYDVFPNYNWIPSLFTKVEKDWFEKKENHYIFMNYLMKQEKIEKVYPDLYKLTYTTLVEKYRGKTLYKKYNNSIFNLLKSLYPEHRWFVWKFPAVTPGTWQDKNILKEYMVEFEKHYGYESPEDFYNITREHFKNFYGGTPVSKYKIEGMVKILYPDYEFNDLLWINRPNVWRDKDGNLNTDNLKKFSKIVEKKFNIKKLEDLYEINYSLIKTIPRGSTVIPIAGGIYEFCNIVYPNFNWEKSKFKTNLSTLEFLFEIVLDLLNIANYESQVRKFINGKLHISDYVIHLDNYDIWVELDGKPDHFVCIKRSFGRNEKDGVNGFITRQIKDKEKNLYCMKQNNTILIRIPYTISNVDEMLRITSDIFNNIENQKQRIIYADRQIYINHAIKMGKVNCAIKTLQRKVLKLINK